LFLGEILSTIEMNGILDDNETKKLSLMWGKTTKNEKSTIRKIVGMLEEAEPNLKADTSSPKEANSSSPKEANSSAE